MIHADLRFNREKKERCLFMHLLPTNRKIYFIPSQRLKNLHLHAPVFIYNMLSTSVSSFISPPNSLTMSLCPLSGGVRSGKLQSIRRRWSIST